MNGDSFHTEDEDLIAMVQFHMSSTVTLMRTILDNNLIERDLFRRVLNEMASNAGCVREEALWETLKDFLVEGVDRVLAPVLPIREGEDVH